MLMSDKDAKSTSAAILLRTARELMEQRGEDYDSEGGERSAGKTAAAFNAITGRDLTASEVWLMLLLLKQVRQWSTERVHVDSAEDSIAYAALLAEELINGG